MKLRTLLFALSPNNYVLLCCCHLESLYYPVKMSVVIIFVVQQTLFAQEQCPSSYLVAL
jgi:hypothetical protein